MRRWIEFNWLGICSSGRLFWRRQWNFRFHKSGKFLEQLNKYEVRKKEPEPQVFVYVHSIDIVNEMRLHSSRLWKRSSPNLFCPSVCTIMTAIHHTTSGLVVLTNRPGCYNYIWTFQLLSLKLQGTVLVFIIRRRTRHHSHDTHLLRPAVTSMRFASAFRLCNILFGSHGVSYVSDQVQKIHNSKRGGEMVIIGE
jgi:hypothetical protein